MSISALEAHDEVQIHADRLKHVYGGNHPIHNTSGHGQRVTTVDWNRDGGSLASGADDGTVFLWSTGEFKRFGTNGFSKHANPVDQVEWSASDSYTLGTSSTDQHVLLWDIRDGGASPTCNFANSTSSSDHGKAYFAFSRQSDHYVAVAHVVGRSQSLVVIYDIRQQKALDYNISLPVPAAGLRWLPSSNLLAIAASHGRLIFAHADVSSSQSSNKMDISADTRQAGDQSSTARTHTINGHTAPVFALASNQHMLVSGGQDSMVHVWDANTLGCLHSFSSYDGSVRALSISHDGSVIAAAYDKEISLFSKHAIQVGAVQTSAWATSFHPSRLLLAFGGESNTKSVQTNKFPGHLSIVNFESDK